ncbi:MAG: Co2+/Mg2+ efflux protein ApaG [Bacteroidetes bacterium]|nr:Co2+/Mg2+ efflux protein ApaG [Bacteroidota bacterium]
MVNAITNDIDVTVESNYIESQSKPEMDFFLFSYKIKISNQGNEAVQLISRYWNIFDSINEKHIVEGEGVVGFKPLIEPGQFFEYESFCQLKSDGGTMKGYYTLLKVSDNSYFKAVIPDFILMPEYRFN